MPYLLFLIFITLNLSQSEFRFVKTKISENITISLPESFWPMSEQDIASRHISQRKPLAIFTNQDRTIDFSVNTAISQWPPSDLPLMKGFYKASIGSFFSDVEFLSDEIKNIDDREFAVLEFISVTDAEGGATNQGALRNYTLAHYAIINGRTYVFTFTCSARLKEKWQPAAWQVMESIKIKKARK
ncbi:hypothetical protein BH23BAC1_BH23BAC1_15040 [soil metagenome]